MSRELPLGQHTTYTEAYDSALLHPIARAESRVRLGLQRETPFFGEDIWNAWDLTWLAPNGQPRVAAAEMRVPASSVNIIESKSLKLYLNSLSMTRFDNKAAVCRRISDDVSAVLKADVTVCLDDASSPSRDLRDFPGHRLDELEVECTAYSVDAALLSASGQSVVDETLVTHSFRSLCPVTAQPDLGSVAIRYSGVAIDHAGMLRYLVSFRQHNDFHEACVERMFTDIQKRCTPTALAVYARFQRRGGIDINPFRSTADESADNLRLWRQ
jgi:7-cyano-7-deazaguanine reductase